jgi:hypothetical protein
MAPVGSRALFWGVETQVGNHSGGARDDCEEPPMSAPLPILAALVLVLGLAPTLGFAQGRGARDDTRRDLREVAAKITGGASLLAGVDSGPSGQAFQERARRFEEAVERRRPLADDWRELRASFEDARRSARRKDDPRVVFLVTHLHEDLLAGAPLVAASAERGRPSRDETAADASGRLSFIDRETCVGTGRSGTPCTTPRDVLSFRIPRNVEVIRRLDGEWRDFGRGANAEIHLNDRLVWRTDVEKDWDRDDKTLDLRVPPGSTLTVRSSNGDPIWIRRLSAETLAPAGAEQTTEQPWDALWGGRN